MNQTQFYTVLQSIKDLRTRIHFFKTAEYDFVSDPHPDAMVMVFFDVRSIDEALLVAEAFEFRFGSIIICRDASLRDLTITTIVDALDSNMHIRSYDPIGFDFIHKVFRIIFQKAFQCDPIMLRKIYNRENMRDYTMEDLNQRGVKRSIHLDNEYRRVKMRR